MATTEPSPARAASINSTTSHKKSGSISNSIRSRFNHIRSKSKGQDDDEDFASTSSPEVQTQAYDVPQSRSKVPSTRHSQPLRPRAVSSASTVPPPPIDEEPSVDLSLQPHIKIIMALAAGTSVATLILSRFHWSLGWVAIAIGLHALWKILLSRDATLQHQARVSTAEKLWKNKDKTETVEWMNSVLSVVWPLINSDVFLPFVDLLEDALQLQVPGIVHAVRVEDLDQGVIPLRVDGFKMLPSDEDSFVGRRQEDLTDAQRKEDKDLAAAEGITPVDLGEHVNMEVSFSYRAPARSRKGGTKSNMPHGEHLEAETSHAAPPGQSSPADKDKDTPVETIHMLLYLAIGLQKIAAIEVPVWCSVQGISGRMRLRLQLIPSAPFIKHVGFTMLEQPKLEISAKPLGKKMVIDAMHLPLLSSYVLKSIQTTVAPFICPKSYTIDLGGLLGAGDGPKNTYAVGVVCVIFHQATDLPAADTNGLSDPFISVSYARAGKPLFRTRVLTKTRNACFQEAAYLLVSPDEIRDHERVRFTIFDADRFSADDPLGKVEVSLDRLIQRSLARETDEQSSKLMETRTDALMPMRKGAPTSGQLRYSIVFSRLVQPRGNRVAATPHRVKMMQEAAARAGTDEPNDSQQSAVPATEDEEVEVEELEKYETGFDRFIRSVGLPVDDEVLRARAQRKSRVTRLVDMLSGEAQATLDPPSPSWPSGILAFHVHSIQQLEVTRTQRSYKSTNLAGSANTAQSSNNNEDSIGEGAASRMPSSYVQVMINDEPVLRTRTKTYNPRPFINAGSERYIADWRNARIDFVVREQRQRETDAILGIVDLKVSDVLKRGARHTGWYTIVGGLGYGKMQVTLLWRSIHLSVPKPLRGWNLGVVQVNQLSAKLDSSSVLDDKEAHFVLQAPGASLETNGIRPDPILDNARLYKWEGKEKESLRLAFRQRAPGSLIITLKSSPRVAPGKRRPRAIVCIPLLRLVDNEETTIRAPLWVSSDWFAVEQGTLRATTVDLEEEKASDRPKEGTALEDFVSSLSPSSSSFPNELAHDSGRLQRAGYVDISLTLYNGLSEEHRSMTAGDHELRFAYESWRCLADCGERSQKTDNSQSGPRYGENASPEDSPQRSRNLKELPGVPEYRPWEDDQDIGEDGDPSTTEGLPGRQRSTSTSSSHPSIASTESRQTRRRNLHRQERGAAQIKGFRTVSWLKQNVEDGTARLKKLGSEQSKRLGKMEDEGVSSF